MKDKNYFVLNTVKSYVKMYSDVHIKFRKNLFRHSNANKGKHTSGKLEKKIITPARNELFVENVLSNGHGIICMICDLYLFL
jgi:hypothetical protein